MRIIAGEFRGARSAPKGEGTRPTTDETACGKVKRAPCIRHSAAV